MQQQNQRISKVKDEQIDKRLSPKNKSMKNQTSPNHNDFMLSGFEEEEEEEEKDDHNDQNQNDQNSLEILKDMILQLCPFCFQCEDIFGVVSSTPYKVVELHKLKNKKFPIHQECEEGAFHLKNEAEFINISYSFWQVSTSTFSSHSSSNNTIIARNSHLLKVEIQHPISTASIFTIQNISDLYSNSQKEFISLDLSSSNQLYIPEKYIIPIHVFSLKATVFLLEKTGSFSIDIVANLNQFESETEVELKGSKEQIGELKVCGVVLEKNQAKMNFPKFNNYKIPSIWFSQGTGSKVFHLISVELFMADSQETGVRSIQKLSIQSQQLTPPLSPNTTSPLFSPQRTLTPPEVQGSITPPNEQLNYAQIKGQIVAKVQKNKEWSIAVQNLIKKSSESGNFQEIQLVMDEIKGNLDDLMKHPYGNYFTKSLLQLCNKEQRFQILQEIRGSLVEISQNPQGTHAIQYLVESSKNSSDKEQVMIVEGIEDQVIQMALSPQGMYVINKIVQNFALGNIVPIYEAVYINFREIIRDKQGVCVVKSLMMRLKDIPQKKNTLLQLLKCDIKNIIIDKYGNYALQEALKIYSNEDIEFIGEYVLENLMGLAQNQLTSYIVELVLQYSKQFRQKCVFKIMANIQALFIDPFGKFVINRVISLEELDPTLMSSFKQALHHLIQQNPKAGVFYTNPKQQTSPRTRKTNTNDGRPQSPTNL